MIVKNSFKVKLFLFDTRNEKTNGNQDFWSKEKLNPFEYYSIRELLSYIVDLVSVKFIAKPTHPRILHL